MSTGQATIANTDYVTPQYRLTVSQYERMIEGGIIAEDDEVELLDGILVPKKTKNAPHETATLLVKDELEKIIPKSWHVRSQSVMKTRFSMPEPDVSIVSGTIRDYASQLPGPDNIGLVVEVADTSLLKDRTVKASAYARAGIATSWILNLKDFCLEVYSQPTSGKSAGYRSCDVKKAKEILTLSLKNKSVGKIKVADLLP